LIEDEKIHFTSTLETNASIEEVVEITAKADLIAVDENFDEMFLLNDNKISLKDLKKDISIPIYVVSSNN
jgi:hypothetical protein